MSDKPKRGVGRPRKYPVDAIRCWRCERPVEAPGLCETCRPKEAERSRKNRQKATPEQKARAAMLKRLKRQQAKESMQ